MAQTAQVQISYGIVGDTACGGVLFEIPETEVTGGMELEILIWGNSLDVLLPYALYKGTDTMGAGNLTTVDALEITEMMDFAEESKFQAKYPIHRIVRVEAISEVLIIDSSGNPQSWAHPEEDVTHRFSRTGYSCVKETLGTPLYGSFRVSYERTPYVKQWYWTVPTGEEGLHWFFIYKSGILKNKFSLYVPDLAASGYGKKNVLLRILVHGSEIPIPDADVWIDDIHMGLTDADGAIPLNNVDQGPHNLKVEKEGFVGTQGDLIYNEEFMVY